MHSGINYQPSLVSRISEPSRATKTISYVNLIGLDGWTSSISTKWTWIPWYKVKITSINWLDKLVSTSRVSNNRNNLPDDFDTINHLESPSKLDVTYNTSKISTCKHLNAQIFFMTWKQSKHHQQKMVNKSKVQDGKHRAFLTAKSTSITSPESNSWNLKII